MPATNADIAEAVAAKLSLTDAQQAVPSSNGSTPEYALRVAWCRSHLKSAGLVDNVEQGNWELTSLGKTVPLEEVEALYRQRVPLRSEGAKDPEADPTNDDDDQSSWQDELLDILHNMPWQGFEQLARRLLLAAGFDEVEVTRSSHDGGIDGFGTYRPSGLISFRTSFQCKRWKSPVRSPEVQAFQGAILGQSDRGIIITTSYFTRDAIEQASRPGGLRIDLIDSARLVELLKEHQIGVRAEMIEQVTIDGAYFDQFNMDDS